MWLIEEITGIESVTGEYVEDSRRRLGATEQVGLVATLAYIESMFKITSFLTKSFKNCKQDPSIHPFSTVYPGRVPGAAWGSKI